MHRLPRRQRLLRGTSVSRRCRHHPVMSPFSQLTPHQSMCPNSPRQSFLLLSPPSVKGVPLARRAKFQRRLQLQLSNGSHLQNRMRVCHHLERHLLGPCQIFPRSTLCRHLQHLWRRRRMAPTAYTAHTSLRSFPTGSLRRIAYSTCQLACKIS